MKKISLLISILTISLPVFSQGYGRVGEVVLQVGAAEARAAAATQAAVEQAVRLATLATAQTAQQIPLAKQIFTIEESPELDRSILAIPASAFVIEETYQGHTQLWGVSAAHYKFERPTLRLQASKSSIYVPFAARGAIGMNDIILFPLPKRMVGKVLPLRLADQPVQPGEDLHSVGFFDDKIQQDQHRIVRRVAPARFITSLDIDPQVFREGACGGPVLNQQGEVVGVHAGSSRTRQLGFVIPVAHIRNLLTAYHNNGRFLQPIFFKGVNLGWLNINESIESIKVMRNRKPVDLFDAWHQEIEIDYAHLEKLVSFEPGDQVLLLIQRDPFSAKSTPKKPFLYYLVYDSQTGKITTIPYEDYEGY